MDTLWNKGMEAAQAVEDFTVGNDRTLDLQLAGYDVIGSKAHVSMLLKIGLLSAEEERMLQEGLDEILKSIESGEFKLEDDVEDIHSQVELLLSRKLGETGKKIHAGRSRNDQVLVDVKLFLRDKVLEVRGLVLELFDCLQDLSERHKDVLMPGYTHGQIAMPSSFGLWFGAYAETLADDMTMLRAAYTITDENPLGSAAGYGNSFPLDREMTTELLKFGTLNYNSIAAQMSRGKSEKAVAVALASVAATLNRLAEDCCTFMCQNYAFISFPDNLTTGSSIMPHKKNPDVWEMVRGKCNRIESVPNEITLLTTNLPVGYHRDLQLLKDILFPALASLEKCLTMSVMMLQHIIVRKDILDDSRYDNIFTVEEVNRLALEGIPFRDAYKKVGGEVKDGTFEAPAPAERTVRALHHTHEGSIGNLCTELIRKKMAEAADFGHDSK
jgi:argininosuccinate lyase